MQVSRHVIEVDRGQYNSAEVQQVGIHKYQNDKSVPFVPK